MILGEVDLEEARGRTVNDDMVMKVIRRVDEGNRQTRGYAKDGSPEAIKLDEEHAYLDSLLPQVMTVAAIKEALKPSLEIIKGARNDGQATGLAMKALKEAKFVVGGNEVAQAVKELRA